MSSQSWPSGTADRSSARPASTAFVPSMNTWSLSRFSCSSSKGSLRRLMGRGDSSGSSGVRHEQ